MLTIVQVINVILSLVFNTLFEIEARTIKYVPRFVSVVNNGLEKSLSQIVNYIWGPKKFRLVLIVEEREYDYAKELFARIAA